MKIDPFGVEMWMNAWETKCELNLAETCVESLTISDMLATIGQNEKYLSKILPLKMTYGSIKGSERLRHSICALYDKQKNDNILVTHGTIGANMLVYKALVEPGDRVISVVPTYQQHYSIPESIGAEIDLLHLREDVEWLPDLDLLKAKVLPGTKIIALTNPNNPTGALLSAESLGEIAEIAATVGAWILCDEVYRGTDQHGNGKTKSIVDIYEKGISTAGLSKAFSLAGLRLGWIAGPQGLLNQVMIHRDYDTISVGVIDDHFATLALDHCDRLLERSRRITRNNLSYLAQWMSSEPKLSWVKPKSGTTALVKLGMDMPSLDFCIALLKKESVMFTPGSALGIEGYVRIGYANSHEILVKGLERVSYFLSEL